MKKIFYLFLIGIFLLPKTVFAQLSLAPDYVIKDNTNDSFVTVTQYNYPWFVNTKGTPYANKWAYSYSVSQYISDTIYVANFLMFVPYGTNADGETTQVVTPVVLVGGSTCKVTSTVRNASFRFYWNWADNSVASENYPYSYNGNIYSVVCENVNIHENNLYADVLFGPNNISHVYMGYLFLNQSSVDVALAQNNQALNDIKEQQQKTNDKLDETNKNLEGINDSLNDSNVDMDGANSFFGDFSDTDHGGISGVITAPLRFVNKMTGTCSSISLDVLGADVVLPCGDTLFWNKPDVASFRVVWNVLFGGAFLYLMISKLFKVIEGLKNPDDSRIEVMKL